MPLWVRPAAAAGASDTARQARFREAVCAGGPPAPGCPQQTARKHASSRRRRSRGVWTRTGLGGRWRRAQGGAGAGRGAARRDPGECCWGAGCGAPCRAFRQGPEPGGGRRGVFSRVTAGSQGALHWRELE